EDFLEGSSAGPSAPALAPRTGERLASSAADADAHATTALSGPPELPHASAPLPRNASAHVTVPAALEGAPGGLEATRGRWPSNFGGGETGVEPFSRDALRRLMTSHAGVLRSGELLAEAGRTLRHWAAVVRPDAVDSCADPVAQEDRNLLLAAQLLVDAALQRGESLGAHYRSDETVETLPLPPKASLLHD
ncbi:MAG TPA: L-aspartate oxidase, partial [Arthrobacter sp.]|nr:L-aspartate oxidase [Arthrobacter sp.]